MTETATGGATSSSITDDGVAVIAAPAEDEQISTAQLTAANTFDLASLAVTKTIDGAVDNPAAAADFTVELVCTWVVDGAEQELAVPGGGQRTLAADETVTYADLPVGADCVLTETDAGEAVATRVVVDGESTDGVTAAVSLDGTEPVQAEVVNTFDPEPPSPSATPTPAPSPTPTPAPSATGDDPDLPSTGASVGGLVSLALMLMVAGAAVVLVRRRRSA